MNPDLFTAIILLAAVVSIVALCLIYRYDRDAQSYRRLVEAAGSKDLAELAIRQAREIRIINERERDARTDALMRRGFRALSSNVVQLRVRNQGRDVHFTPDGAA